MRSTTSFGDPTPTITRLVATLLITGLTFACSPDLESVDTPTGPPTETPTPPNPPNPGTPPGVTAPFLDRTSASGFGGLRFGPAIPNADEAGIIIGGVAAGDVDNDGDIDLFVVTEGTGDNTLYLNQGDGTFSASLLGALSNTPLFESGPLFVDYDGDGFLDIIMGGIRSDADRDQLYSVRVYRNRGDLSFEDVSATAGLTPPLGLATFSISAADIDGDQRLDLFLSHWFSPNGSPENPILHGGGFLWKNEVWGSV